MRKEFRFTRLAVMSLILATLLSLVPVTAFGEGETNLLISGNFEDGFQDDGVGIPRPTPRDISPLLQPHSPAHRGAEPQSARLGLRGCTLVHP